MKKERIILDKQVVKRRDSSGKLVEKEIDMLLIDPSTNLYVEINEKPTLKLLHKLRTKYHVRVK